MSLKPAIFLTSVLALAALAASPITAQAGGMTHMGSYGGGMGHGVPKPQLDCPPPGKPAGLPKINIYKPTTINNNINVYKPVTINKDINVYKPVTVINNIDNSKNIEINKPVTINKTIDNSKNINITNNIDNSKNIDISKTIIINKGGHGGGSGSNSSSSSQADAVAEATAIASAVAAAAGTASANSSSNAILNFTGGNSTSSASSSSGGSSSVSSSSAFGYSGAGMSFGGSSYIAETPGPFAGGDLGSINVEAAPAQCTWRDATVIKAIHAICISDDHHEFPAAHMVPDTWIDASYDGEIARCIAGSHLKITIGSVFQSNEGMASSWSHGEVLECADHEAIRHFKDGMLKCAPAEKVVDCTERTNLRKYGTADMFFTYRTKVCLETHEEFRDAALSRNTMPARKEDGYMPAR